MYLKTIKYSLLKKIIYACYCCVLMKINIKKYHKLVLFIITLYNNHKKQMNV